VICEPLGMIFTPLLIYYETMTMLVVILSA